MLSSVNGPITPQPRAIPGNPALRMAQTEAHLSELLGGNEDSVDSLKSDLTGLCKEVRQEHPLSGDVGGADAAKGAAIARVHALANRIGMYASLACAPSPAGDVSSELCEKIATEDAERLRAALEDVYASPASAVAPEGPGPRDGLIRWTDVPEGSFQFGYDRQPVSLPGFRISKYPVTNQQFNEFVEATGYRPQGSWSASQAHLGSPSASGRALSGENGQSPLPAWADHPVTNVTFFDAQAFCKWAKVRLPSEQEWEKAARGTDGRAYPWGDAWEPDRCNNDGSGTTPVNRYEAAGNVSPYGAVDMVGNVLEWVEGQTQRRPGAVLLKGGAWTNYASANNQPFDCMRHTSESPESSYRGFGFRVAVDGVSEQPSEDIGWQLAAVAAGQPALAAPTTPLPAPLESRLERLRDDVARLTAPPAAGVGAGEPPLRGGSAKAVIADLGGIVGQARAERPPLEAGASRDAVARLHSAANQVAMYAGFAASGSPPHGMAMEVCTKQLHAALDAVDASLRSAYAEPVASRAGSGAPADLIEWLPVAAGEAVIGRAGDRKHLDGFEISKYPVTNEQFNAFVQATGYQPEGGWHSPDGGRYGDTDTAQSPVVNVSFFDAEAFCEWAGCRLPSEDEWEKAARGTDGLKFPWGDEWRPELVNHEGPMASPVHAHEVAPDGSRGNVSPFGAVDMVGNALEWVDTPAPARPGSVLLKGGAWSNGSLRPFNTVRHTSDLPNAAYRGFGFRVAR